MQILHSTAYLTEDHCRVVAAEASFGSDEFKKVAAAGELEDNVALAVGEVLEVVEDGEAAEVVDFEHEGDLLFHRDGHALSKVGVVDGVVHGDHFDGNVLPGAFLNAFVDHSKLSSISAIN